MKFKTLLVVVFSLFLFFGIASAASELLWQNECPQPAQETVAGDVYHYECYSLDITPTPVPSQEPYPGAPLCANHTVGWHSLWNAELGCHYSHQHGDNPHEVDDLFGAEWLDATGGEVTIAWQPAPTDDLDYRRKHYGLFWMVRRDLPCYSQFGDGCVTAFRAEVHMLPDVYDNYRNTPSGLTASRHVFRVEAIVCSEADPTDCGMIRMGGAQYLGDVLVDQAVVLDFPEPAVLNPGYRTPRPVSLNYWNIGQRSVTTWYPVSEGGVSRLAVEIGDVWSAVNPNDITEVALLGNGNNASHIQAHIVAFSFPRYLHPTLDPDGDGYVDYVGYNTPQGFFTNCDPAQVMCIPAEYVHVPILQYQYRGDYREYDIFFDGESSDWIEYPGSPQ